MQRTIIAAGLVLGSLLTTGLAYAATDGAGDQNVSANVAATLEMDVPADLDLGALDIGDNESSSQGILVKSNVAYGIQIKGDRTNMTEFDPGASSYGAGALAQAFEWKEVSGSYADMSTSNASVVLILYMRVQGAAVNPRPMTRTSSSL